MLRLKLLLVAGLSLALALAVFQTAGAQAQGVAAVTSPLPGALVSGRVPLLGSAVHPQFQRYELAFGYEPNPTSTWFSIQEPVGAPVFNNILGQWDTAGIVDGVYVLRLRVYAADQTFLETFVSRVRVQNATAVPAATEPPGLGTPLVITATPPRIALPATSTPRPVASRMPVVVNAPVETRSLWLDTLADALVDGVRLTLVIFVGIGFYGGLRAALRYRPR